jgi:small subunit ribosomal protein S8
MTDPIADFLTRIRNAIHAAHETVQIPASKLKTELARILTEQGYIESWSVAPAPEGGAGQVIEIRLKYTADRRSAIAGLKRVSRPGQRTYVQAGGIPKVLGGMGTSIVSTSQGVMTGPRRGRRRRGPGPGLVAQERAGEREERETNSRCPGSEDSQSPCRAA